MTAAQRWTIGGVVMAVLATAPMAGRQAATFDLRPGDHVAIIGNALAERFQYDGWLEAVIQARFPTHELVFRNLGFSGDEVDPGRRLRSRNFGTPDEWLSGQAEGIGGYEENRLAGINTQADAIVAFFGYNESYAGEAGLPAFRETLRAWLTHTLAQRYNGTTAPRVVLLSPIAHEDLGSPDLPDGRENNVRLALYARAMGEEAKAAGVTFVDLFTISQRLYAESSAPLTMQGVHLNAEGHRLVAQAIDRALFGAPPRLEAGRLERVRQAVADKNFYWFNRYRATDGYNTWGERAFLNFVRGIPRNVNEKQLAQAAPEDRLPTNYDVLQREMVMLDRMTANRDRRIWAAARGETVTAADDNVPPPVDPRTNLLSTPPPLSGTDAIAKMTVHEGLKVELFASEQEFPELVNPVQMAFDTRGRLWVAVWKSYPHWQPGTPMDDKLLILEDTNGDGRADRRTVFAGDLNNPTGFEFYNGGVLLAQGPNLVFLKDTNGDDRYDVRENLLHGFDTADTHHTINSFTFDPGGALYMQEGIFHRTQVESPWGPATRQADGGVYRFEPRTWKFETFIPMNFPNPHGHVWDRWGRNIVFDATGGQPIYGPSASTKKYYPMMDSTKAPQVYARRMRPVAGIEILSSRHFPESLQGNLMVLNVIGLRGIMNYALEEDGAGLRGTEATPLVQSEDENFRPVDAEVAPDGSLYFLDWYNPVIGHMQHNLRHRSRDSQHGRVYRVTAAGRPLLTPPQIAGAPIPALLELLKSPEDRVRYRARIELGGRDTQQVIAAVTAWLGKLDQKDPAFEHHRLEALWVHQWHNRVNEALLDQVLRSPEPFARAAAARVLCYWRDRVKDPLARLRTLAGDEHPAVRLEAVRTASFFQTPDAAEIVAIAQKLPQDRFLSYTSMQALRTLKTFEKPTSGVD